MKSLPGGSTLRGQKTNVKMSITSAYQVVIGVHPESHY